MVNNVDSYILVENGDCTYTPTKIVNQESQYSLYFSYILLD